MFPGFMSTQITKCNFFTNQKTWQRILPDQRYSSKVASQWSICSPFYSKDDRRFFDLQETMSNSILLACLRKEVIFNTKHQRVLWGSLVLQRCKDFLSSTTRPTFSILLMFKN